MELTLIKGSESAMNNLEINIGWMELALIKGLDFALRWPNYLLEKLRIWLFVNCTSLSTKVTCFIRGPLIISQAIGCIFKQL